MSEVSAPFDPQAGIRVRFNNDPGGPPIDIDVSELTAPCRCGCTCADCTAHGDHGFHLVLTGPVKGKVTTSSGTVYDVSPPALNAKSHADALEIARCIQSREVE